MAHNGADNEEAEAVFKEAGLDGLKKFMDEKLDAWKNSTVKIAVTGQSGSGKSSLINRLRDLTPDDAYLRDANGDDMKDENGDEVKNPLYAEAGITETTAEIKTYQFPSNPLLEICDLPGAGTEQFPINSYPDMMKFRDYDAFILITKDRFFENDKRLATIIQTTYNKPFFFCRTKMDATMKEEADNLRKKFDATVAEKKVRDNCKKELGDHEKEVYLLAKVEKKKINGVMVSFPDNEKLKEDLINSLQDMQKTAMLFSVNTMSKKLIEMKAEELGARIKWAATASAVGGAVPIPGLSMTVDLAVVVKEAIFQRNQLHVDDGTMTKYTEMFGPEFQNKLGAGASKAMKSFLVKKTTLTALLTTTMVAAEAVENSFKIGIPILGSIAGAGISYGVTFTTLRTALNAHAEIAQKVIIVVNQLAIERGMKS